MVPLKSAHFVTMCRTSSKGRNKSTTTVLDLEPKRLRYVCGYCKQHKGQAYFKRSKNAKISRLRREKLISISRVSFHKYRIHTTR